MFQLGRTVLLVVGFLVGLFLVSTVLLAAFVLLWPSQRRRHSASGIVSSRLAYAHSVSALGYSFYT